MFAIRLVSELNVLDLKNLSIVYGNKTLVDNVSFSIEQGEMMALIGESGSGKSITASVVGRILPGTLKVKSGSVILDGMDMLTLSKEQLRKARGEKVSYVFQDYQNAFTPFIRIGKQMHEMINAHKDMSKKECKRMILNSFESVGLDADRVYNSYPFQLSGGQMQRCAIAQAIIFKPTLLIADEPTTALDSVSTAMVLSLIEKIKKDIGCSILFITHDLRTVKKYADKMAIMYKGNIVEVGGKNDILAEQKHIYTRNLFASVPPLHNAPKRLPILEMPGDEGIV